jgi:hypothetical protein
MFNGEKTSISNWNGRYLIDLKQNKKEGQTIEKVGGNYWY